MTLTDHQKRWLTALVLLPLVVWVIGWAPPIFLAILLSLFSACGMYETYQIIGLHPFDKRAVVAIFLGSLALIALALLKMNPGVLAVFFLFSIYLLLLVMDHSSSRINKTAPLLLLGLIYVPFMLSYAIKLMELDQGRLWLFYVLLLTFATDVGAFYSGRLLGGPKLFPQVSPAKTWSGALGGLLLSCLVSVLIGVILLDHLTLMKLIVFAVVISLTAMLGDLFESMLKRSGNVKDASELLPGHGGVMDRFDSLLFTIPLMYYMVSLGGL